MSGFFVDPENVFDDEIRITGSDVNHIKNVMRMKAGDVINVSDGTGFTYVCEIADTGKDELRLIIKSKKMADTELGIRISLYQGLPKKDKMELIIQKAVELGVYDIYPVITERAVVKIDPRKVKEKVERWNRISESAAKQSGRSIIPVVHEPLSYKNALTSAVETCDTVLIPYENVKGMAYADECINQAVRKPASAVFIGPEGGFSDEEAELAVSMGAKAISLGSRILRTETAGLCTLSVMMFKAETL